MGWKWGLLLWNRAQRIRRQFTDKAELRVRLERGYAD